MKKILCSLLTLIIPFVFISKVNAASATIAVSSSANQVIVGKDVTVYVTISSAVALGSWEYTLNYDNSVFRLISSDVALHYASYANNGNTKSVTYKYTFIALKSGSSKFYIDSSMAVAWDESILTVNNGSKTLSTLTYSEYQASLSKNNNLKSLSVEGYEITPEFKKDVLEYSVKVNEDETSITIKAILEDGTASVSGAGEVEVSAGSNAFDIVVIAQNGSEKTYKLNVEVIDKNPINVEIAGEKFTVVKLASNLVKPDSYVEKTIVIDEFEVPAFYSEVTEFTLVGLKDEEGNISLYIYDDNKYTKYTELSFGNITIYPMEMKKELKNYYKTKINIQDVDVEVLTLKDNSRVKLVYGLNVETKEEGLFLYDTKDNSLIKYDEEYISLLEEKNTMLTYSTLAFVVSTILALVGIIALSKRKKNKPQKEVSTAAQRNNVEKNKKCKIQEVEKQKEDPNEIVETSKEEVYDIFEDDRKKSGKRK